MNSSDPEQSSSSAIIGLIAVSWSVFYDWRDFMCCNLSNLKLLIIFNFLGFWGFGVLGFWGFVGCDERDDERDRRGVVWTGHPPA